MTAFPAFVGAGERKKNAGTGNIKRTMGTASGAAGADVTADCRAAGTAGTGDPDPGGTGAGDPSSGDADAGGEGERAPLSGLSG